MTAKEKAKELVKKYINCEFNEFEYVWVSVNGAKQCALIAVNEILDANPMYYTGFEYETNFEYWQDVKNEIEKL